MPRANWSIHGIDAGYASGDLTYTPHEFAGQASPGDVTVAGTSFTASRRRQRVAGQPQ